jgi:phosphatidylserine decarboxylase
MQAERRRLEADDSMVKDGYKFAALPLVLGAVMVAAGWKIAGALLLFLGAFVLYFFRDPDRVTPAEPGAVVSPADGRVVEIADEPFKQTPGRRVSIFLSIWDVHVNRAPVAGSIQKVEYRPGRFYAALRARASAENEQNVVHISTQQGEMSFKQIAGWIARRIQFWKREGEDVSRGERVGMIRFGSRVDVWLPSKAEIVVRQGQHVSGGSTILARWP